MREMTNNKDLLRKEICKLNIGDFSESENNTFINSEDNRDSVIDILGKLKEIAKIQQRYLTVKSENISCYNEAWGVCNVFPDFILNRFLSFEIDLRNSYSELFSIMNGNIGARIILSENKNLCVYSILEEIEDIVSMEYKGKFYSELSKAKNMKFEEFRLTKEFDEETKKYEIERDKRISLIGKIIETIDEYQCYALFNKEDICKLTYVSVGAKVDNIA